MFINLDLADKCFGITFKFLFRLDFIFKEWKDLLTNPGMRG